MRKITLLLLMTLSLSLSNAQQKLTPRQWQEDLEYLREKIIEDYQHLFYKVTEKEWLQAVDDLYNRIPGMDDSEIAVGIAEIIAMFGYGHTALWLTAWRYNNLVSFHQMPYNLYWFSDGVFVQGVHQHYEEAAGAKVLKVGKLPVEEAIEAIRPVVSIENEQFFKAHGLHYLGVPEVLKAKGVIDDVNSVTLTLEKNEKEFTLTFTPRPSEEFPGYYGLIQSREDWLDARPGVNTPYWLKHLDRKYYFEYIEKNRTVYVRQSEIQDDPSEDIPSFYKRVFDFIDSSDVEKLVLDLRLNSGGNNYKNKPVVTGLVRCEKINQPGKLFVILGRRTFSACQNLVNELENYTNVAFVGEPTAENVNFFGDSRIETLPNSRLDLRLSYLWWQDKDPRDRRPWTAPHIPVELSSRDYRYNKDPVLETILAISEFEMPVNPMDHLTSLFMQGKLEEVKITAKEYVKDPAYKYFDFENRFDDAGNQLVGINRLEEAIFILELNRELFPESARCYLSLGEAYWKYGDPAKAENYFQKAARMDPTGRHGNKARARLEKITAGK